VKPKKNQEEIAKSLLMAGFSIEEVIKHTQLTFDEAKKL